jgi:hypothetical protein
MSDMPEIPKEVIEHKLGIDPAFKPIKQKERKYTPERHETIRLEVKAGGGEEDIHMVEVEGMNTMKEQDYPMNHQPEVEGMDREDSGIWEDMTFELEVVEREPKEVVLVRHWTSDGAARYQ